MNPLPEKFIQTIVGVHKQRGELWLDAFEQLIQTCEEKWAFSVQPPFPLSYNFVAPVVFEDGREAVLKLCVPSEESVRETTALRLYQGKGIARLLEADEDKGILLIERLAPGQTLKSIANEDESTLLAAKVMQNLSIPAPPDAGFPTVAQWAQGLEKLRLHYNGGTGPLPEGMVLKAEALFRHLFSTATNLQLLHGDLHHENILSAERVPWLAIDPKGVIGEREYEVISFLLNNLPMEDAISVIQRRVDLFVKELQLNRERVLAYGYSHAILAAWWCIEDGTDGTLQAIQKAKIFDTLLNT